MFGVVLAGGVYGGGDAHAADGFQPVCRAAGGAVVHVQGDKAAPVATAVPAAPALQFASNESSNVFQPALLVFGHGEVFGVGFRTDVGGIGVSQQSSELIPVQFFVLPSCSCPASGSSDCNCFHALTPKCCAAGRRTPWPLPPGIRRIRPGSCPSHRRPSGRWSSHRKS